MTNDICILHDQFRVMGGAERVACEMARALDAPILAARVDDGVPPDDVDVRQIFSGWPARAMHRHYLVQDLFQMFAWQHRPEVYDYQTVLVNKTNPLWYVPRDDQTVIGYLHSTPRGFYDQFYNQGTGLFRSALKTGMKALFETNRIRPDAWACNSDLVKRRAALYWDRQERIRTLYPPVPVHNYSAGDYQTKPYYLAFGRLEDHKRFGEVIRSFQNTGKPLIIGGDGQERERLESLADGHDNIRLVGYMSEEEKQRRLSEATALIAPHEREDFGLTVIEAFAAGTPVIGVNEGFTKHQIIDGVNGHLYTRGVSLGDTIAQFERQGVAWDEHNLERFAERFSVERFRTELREWVQAAQEATAIEAPWEREDVTELTAALDGGGA